MNNKYTLIQKHYNENKDRLVILFSNRAGGVANSEDVVQEAYTRALKYNRSFNPDVDELNVWFNKILNNALRNAQQAERRLGMGVEYSEDMDEVIDLLDWEDNMVASIKRDVATKKGSVRQVLQLYLFKQYKPREISQILDISNAYVRTIAKEFKQELREKYGKVFE